MPRPPSHHLRPLLVAGVATLLAVPLFQLNLTARRNSITWDEDDHIYAGYLSWKHADFGLNPEHPPLVKLLAALPLLELPLRLPSLQNREFKIEAFLGGKDFLFQNDADGILLRARTAVGVPFTWSLPPAMQTPTPTWLRRNRSSERAFVGRR